MNELLDNIHVAANENHTGMYLVSPNSVIEANTTNGIVNTTSAMQIISTFLPELTDFNVKDGTTTWLLCSTPTEFTCAAIWRCVRKIASNILVVE